MGYLDLQGNAPLQILIQPCGRLLAKHRPKEQVPQGVDTKGPTDPSPSGHACTFTPKLQNTRIPGPVGLWVHIFAWLGTCTISVRDRRSTRQMSARLPCRPPGEGRIHYGFWGLQDCGALGLRVWLKGTITALCELPGSISVLPQGMDICRISDRMPPDLGYLAPGGYVTSFSCRNSRDRKARPGASNVVPFSV